MAIAVRKMSWWDTLRFHGLVTTPNFLLGLVAPNRVFVSLLSRWDAGRFAMRFLSDLRQKYECDHLRLWFPFTMTLLVLSRESGDAILDSHKNAADPPLKKLALSRFVPDALVISSGDEWSDRRPFNERVLDFGVLHRHSEAFKEIVFREVDQLTAARSGELRWADFQTLGQRISHQVILGSGQIESEMAVQLAHMVSRSNWSLRHRRYFAAFYEHIEHYLARHRAFYKDSNRGDPVPTSCLLHESATLLEHGSATSSTQVPTQIGFWFFVLKDAIELHVARTLALIAAHSEVQDRVREEIRKVPALTAQAINDFQYLNACIGEQLRLWTPVPILLRRAVEPFFLRGEIPIEAGQQILFHTGFYHRDPRVFGEVADKFSPDSVTNNAFPRVYFFSRHRQSCVGESLARFLLKATLASLLARFWFELVGPRIGRDRIPYLYDHFKVELRAHSDV
jgi:cytochrome P450